MKRTEQIEKIIIGTILNTTDGFSWMDSVRYCITPDMIKDEKRKKIYSLAVKLYDCGSSEFTPKDILDYCLLNKIEYDDILDEMLGLAASYYYMSKKVSMIVRYSFIGKVMKPVKFDDYVTRFILNTFKNNGN